MFMEGCSRPSTDAIRVLLNSFQWRYLNVAPVCSTQIDLDSVLNDTILLITSSKESFLYTYFVSSSFLKSKCILRCCEKTQSLIQSSSRKLILLLSLYLSCKVAAELYLFKGTCFQRAYFLVSFKQKKYLNLTPRFLGQTYSRMGYRSFKKSKWAKLDLHLTKKFRNH